MPPLQVKECPADVYERLRACANEENRSIAQQTLTIIEDFLDMRDGLKTPNETRSRHFMAPSSVRADPDIDYLSRRRETFARIEGLPTVAITDSAPRADVILAQVREEEAR